MRRSTPGSPVSVQPEAGGLDGLFLAKLELGLKKLKNVNFKRLTVGEVLLSDGPNHRIEFAGCLIERIFSNHSPGDSGRVLDLHFSTENSIFDQPISSLARRLQKEIMEGADLKLWPNPGTGLFQLDIPVNSKLLDIVIFDVMGAPFLHKKQTMITPHWT